MHKYLLSCIFSLALLVVSSCQPSQKPNSQEVDHVLNQWHQAATDAQLEKYFSLLANDAIYIGTDPGERWTRSEFFGFCKPYFDKGKAWDFKAFDRKIYFSQDGKTAWFNELLNTWMGVCRGSGVLVNQKGEWKISHYHLSVTVKNENIKSFIQIENNSSKQ